MREPELDPDEEAKDRRLYSLAKGFVRGCREVGLSPADAAVVAATVLGIVVAQSNNELTDESLAVWNDIVKATFAMERSLPPPQ